MILTDIDDSSYMECGKNFDHDGPLAYVRGLPSSQGMDYALQWYRPGVKELPKDSPGDSFATNFDLPKLLCDNESFDESLCEGARALWVTLAKPSLIKLGWRDFKGPRTMGFEVRFDIQSNVAPLLLIGWPERDDKMVPRSEKVFGSASMRLDIHVKHVHRACNFDVLFTNRWMKRFYSHGWRGRPSRGMNRRWGAENVPSEELTSNIQGIMRYQPSTTISCLNGRPGDHQNLQDFFTDFAAMLAELGGSNKAA
jgi:hypothetical protein